MPYWITAVNALPGPMMKESETALIKSFIFLWLGSPILADESRTKTMSNGEEHCFKAVER